MKITEPDSHDEPLRKVLKEWHTSTPLSPRFQESVWRRIENTKAQAAPSMRTVIAHWIGTVIQRPVLAASYLTLLFAVGVTAGWTQGRQETARVHNELGQRYVRVLDPYQAPRQ
jgi:hypothetical protein